MRLAIFVKNPAIRARRSAQNFFSALRADGHDLYDMEVRSDLQPGTDMVLSLGGDGTFLSAAKRVPPTAVPVMGVNFGRMGFLSDFSAAEALQCLRTGEYVVEDRRMLQTSMPAGTPLPEGFWPYTLNEVTVHRDGPSVLGVDVALDGVALPTYWADGLLVSTASGSTAYCLSVGGPICTPNAPVLVIAPIAPHNLNVRPLVVPDTTTVTISVTTRDKDATLTMDNRTLPLVPGESFEVSMARFSLRKVRSLRSNFVLALTSKLFWGEDKRNPSSQDE